MDRQDTPTTGGFSLRDEAQEIAAVVLAAVQAPGIRPDMLAVAADDLGG